MSSPRHRAFTLVELLVVIGIVGLLLSILLPTLSKIRLRAETISCAANLRELGHATSMYLNDSKQRLPYPTTTLGERTLWFNVLDPYLADAANPTRTGVAAERSYTQYKQCIVYKHFAGGESGGVQDKLREFSRSYKMNTHLRGFGPARQASITQIAAPSQTVYLGDAISMDITGPIDSQWENGQFSFEVNDKTQASPALRHDGAANILFVDFHVEAVRLKKFEKSLRPPHQHFKADTWESEFIDASGKPVDVPNSSKTAEEQGLRRNPAMPLIWSRPGLYHRP